MEKAIILFFIVIVGLFSIWTYTQVIDNRRALAEMQTQLSASEHASQAVLARAERAETEMQVVLKEMGAILLALEQQQADNPTTNATTINEEKPTKKTIWGRLKKLGEQFLDSQPLEEERIER